MNWLWFFVFAAFFIACGAVIDRYMLPPRQLQPGRHSVARPSQRSQPEPKGLFDP